MLPWLTEINMFSQVQSSLLLRLSRSTKITKPLFDNVNKNER